jgi:hypothetical protein
MGGPRGEGDDKAIFMFWIGKLKCLMALERSTEGAAASCLA